MSKNKKINLWGKLSILSLIVLLCLKFSYLRRRSEFKQIVFSRTKGVKLKTISAQTLIKYCNFIMNSLFIKSCFTRSLVIHDILKRWGYRPEIQIGVKIENEIFESHCWIKLGNFYNESIATRNRFKVIDSIQ